jgi:hypothetical protein
MEWVELAYSVEQEKRDSRNRLQEYIIGELSKVRKRAWGAAAHLCRGMRHEPTAARDTDRGDAGSVGRSSFRVASMVAPTSPEGDEVVQSAGWAPGWSPARLRSGPGTQSSPG